MIRIRIHRQLQILLILLLSGCGGSGGGFDIVLPNAPVIEIQGAEVKPTSAIVRAAIDPNGDETKYWFEWGTDASLGNKTEELSLGDGNQSLSVIWDSIKLSLKLTPNTIYFYRVVAQTKLHTVIGDTMTFATPSIPLPVAITVAPTAVTSSSCTLNGTVNPNGLSTNAWFEWGFNSKYGNTTPRQSLGDSAQDIPYGQSLDKLSTKTTYHYRAMAENDGGIVKGQDKTCVTDSSIVLGTDGSTADADGDGLSDSDEANIYGTNPLMADTDGDGLGDGDEVKIYQTNPRKADSDADSLSDGEEISIYHSDPLKIDSDGDGLGDSDEIGVYKTDPTNWDSDGDTLSDGNEVTIYHTDPTRSDSDGDGLSDDQEFGTYHTDPTALDSDGEGLTDGQEINEYHTEPLIQDTDGDTLDDYQEVMVYHTDPNDADTDGDGFSDGNEVRLGKDPLVPDSEALYPDLVVSSMIGPQGATAGQQINVTVVVKNNGTIDAVAAFDAGVYLSKDAVIDGNDIYVGGRRISSGLLADSSDTGSIVINIPSNLGEGVYYLGAIADAGEEIIESDDTNNAAIASATMSIAKAFDGGDGSDGDVEIVGTFNLNTDSSNMLGNMIDGNGAQPDGFATPLTADARSGSTAITVASTAGFVTGDEILIIQMIHDSNHGFYDFVKNVTVVNNTTLNLSAGVGHNYYATGTTAKGTPNIVQVVRVPNYGDLSVPDYTTLTASPFDASIRVGGVLVFRANTVTVSSLGSINADGLGFPGAPSAVSNSTVGATERGFQGWSYLGEGAASSIANGGGGGGGGAGAVRRPGGGGGGYGAAGTTGDTSSGYTPGAGGGVYGDPQLSRIYLGSGGGSGDAYYVGTSGKGGRGGGLIYIAAQTATIDGTVSANGQNGGNGSGHGGGGGGGSGGSIYLSAPSRAVTGSMVVTAGTGGARGDSSLAYPGGAGGLGRIYQVDASSASIDLAMTDVTGPTSAAQGDTIAVTTTVENVLPTAAGSFNVGIYLSLDSAVTSSDILLGSRLVSELSGNSSDAAITSVTIPSNLYNKYDYRKAITIDSTKVSGTLSNFPVLISVTDSDLRTVANGGKAQDTNGYDIVFRAADGFTALNFEVEEYDAATGQLRAWMRVPTLSGGTDTTIYLYYGSAEVTTSQENPTGVWDGNYRAVFHEDETPGISAQLDSTSHGLTASNLNMQGAASLVDAQIGKGITFDGSNDYQQTSATILNPGSTDWTLELWALSARNSSTQNETLVQTEDGGGVGRSLIYKDYPDYHLQSYQSGTGYDSGRVMSVGSWHHIVLVHDNAAAKLTWYINGTLVNINAGVAVDSSTAVWLFGRSKAANAPDLGYFKGVLDEIRISNTKRSTGWIATEYNNQNMPGTFYSVGAEEALGTPVYYLGAIADVDNAVTELNENNNGLVQASSVTINSDGGLSP